mmetsp:Transcript_13990/g.40813  ORF Transcript_13990/g.40813 Transcript_13990/m.40813 type:complete len:359 (-) Transcript_13990:59-1135(-)
MQAFLSHYVGKDIDQRLDYVDGVQRLRSTSLLFVGALLGFMGFVFAAFLGFWQQMVEVSHRNFSGEPMVHSYFPATVSEMVYNSSSGAGKCFFAFVMIGGICMLLSWYPWHLRNVYIGDDIMLGPPHLGSDFSGRPRGIKLLMLRQFLPPVGIMLVACIPAPPAANRHFTDTVSALVHTLGATMSIGGYAFLELYTLVARPNVVFDTPINGKHRRFSEVHVRGVLIGGCLVSIFMFQMFGFLAGHAEKFGICCPDVWRVPERADWDGLARGSEWARQHAAGLRVEDQMANANGVKELEQTASGLVLFFKLGEYWFEVFSGLFMLASHLAIWWFCPERFTDLEEKLPDPDGVGGHYQHM